MTKTCNLPWKIVLIIFCTLTVNLCLIYFYGKLYRNDNFGDFMYLIIDTDAGADDAVAIFLALAVKHVQVVAITCSYGNTNVTNVENNVLKILTVANRIDIPVYSGAEKPLLRNYTAGDYFGKDGLGDFEFGKDIMGSIDRSKHASIAMIELAKTYSGHLNILTLGPLTNVALAATLDPTFTQNINRFFVMGSTINDSEQNSKDPQVEFNFGLDPHSNAIFLKLLTKFKSLIVPWNVVVKNSISKEWRTEVLGKLNSDVMNFLNNAEELVIQKETTWLPADSIAVATMVWPNLITNSSEANMSSVVCGLSEGSVIVSLNNLINKTKNVEIVRDFNVTAFKDKLLQYLA